MLQQTKMYISLFLFWNHVIYQHTLCFTYWWVFYSSPNRYITFFDILISFLVFSRPNKSSILFWILAFCFFDFFLFLIILEFFTLLLCSWYSPNNKLYFLLILTSLRNVLSLVLQSPNNIANFFSIIIKILVLWKK